MVRMAVHAQNHAYTGPTMDRKIILSLVAVILLVLAAAVLLPGGRPVDGAPKLPWQIDSSGDKLRVFGMTLGETTLAEAQQLLGADGEMTLFRSNSGEYAAEAYFQRASLSGLRADFILSLDLSAGDAGAMFERGLRISKLGSGTRKIELSEPDRQQLRQTAIAHLTYIPASDLEPDLIARQFGQPQEKLAEAEGIEHWLYPHRGLDIAINPNGKEVLQYLQPAQFERATAPLRAQPSAAH